MVAQHPDQQGDHRADEGEGESEPGTQAHGSRTVYPTPRTVWITAGAPAAASLRRR